MPGVLAIRRAGLDSRPVLRTVFFAFLVLTPARLTEDDFLGEREVVFALILLTRLAFFFLAADLALLLPDLDDAENEKAICLLAECVFLDFLAILDSQEII